MYTHNRTPSFHVFLLLLFSLLSPTLTTPPIITPSPPNPPQNSNLPQAQPLISLVPQPIQPNKQLLTIDFLDDNSTTNGTIDPIDLPTFQGFVSILRQNNFFGNWASFNAKSLPFENYFMNPSGLMILEAIDADMNQGGSYFARMQRPRTSSNLYAGLKRVGANQNFGGSFPTWSLLVKIYDGNYVDQHSANIFYQVSTDTPVFFDSNSSTLTINDGVVSIYLKDDSGDANLYKQCPANFSLYFAQRDSLQPFLNPDLAVSDLGIRFQIVSPDCNVAFSSGLLTLDGFEDSYQTNLYTFVACAIAIVQSLGAYRVKFQVQNRKNAFKMSVGSIWLMATVDYYMLILNLVVIFAYSLKFLAPLLLYMFLTFYLERDIIIRVLQAQSKRSDRNIEVSDENCRSCGFHFGLSTLMFVFELIFILMSKLWVIHLTALVFVPQIIYNARKAKPYSFNFFHIILMGTTRIAFVVYLKLYPANIFRLHPDPSFVIIYASIMAVQIFILISQTQASLACLFFMRKKKKSRVLDEDDVCPICMGDLRSDASQTAADSALLDLDDTIETPCSHVFHTECLRKWMKNKVECPVCREKVDEILEEVVSSSGEEDGQRQMPNEGLLML